MKFRENFHPPQHVTYYMSFVTCHMSRVMCHMSHVTCYMSNVMFFLFFFGQSGEAYLWRVRYQRGLPVYFLSVYIFKFILSGWFSRL